MYQLNSEKMFFDIADNQAVIINTETGVYYGTSSLGSAVTERLITGVSSENVLAAIKRLPNCPENIKETFEDFIKLLVEKEILLPAPTVAGGDEDFQEVALTDGFILSIDEFSEVQDLLLADPVHEVDVEMGWPVLKPEEKDENA